MIYISTWDSPQYGATWDSGLQWDVNTGPSNGSVENWLSLITSEHRSQPDYIQTITVLTQPLADLISNERLFPADFDLDLAVGVQLDTIGLWVGVSRYLVTPLTGVYFSLDTAGLGFDEGTWSSRFQPTTQYVALSDDQYRTLLRARIADNNWDGTTPGAYEIWDIVFAGTGYGILIQDFGNMHILYALTGTIPDAVTLALFTGGYLNIKPAGVKIDAYVIPTVPDTPYFAFDAQNDNMAGFDTGAWGQLYSPT